MSALHGGWRNERIGLLGHLELPQFAVLGLSAVPLLIALSQQQWFAFLVWLPIWLLIVAAVAVPIRERPAWLWLADLAGHVLARVFPVGRWQAGAVANSLSSEQAGQLDLPGALQGFTVFDGPPYAAAGMRRLCVLKDPEGSWVMVAKIDHPGLSLTDPDAGDRWADALGDLLSALSRGNNLPSKISIYVRTIPDDGAERAAWLREHSPATYTAAGRDGTPQQRPIPAQVRRDTDEVERSVMSQSVSHEVYVACSFAEDAIAGEAKGSGKGFEGRAAVMYRALPEITNLVTGCGAEAVDWMTKGEVAATIRTGFNPAAGQAIQVARAAAASGMVRPGDEVFTEVTPAAAGPSAAPSPHARFYTHDGFRSAAYSLVLPELGTTVGSLGPLLTPGRLGERRCLALHYEPYDDKAATKAVESDSMKAELAAEVKSKKGFKVSARSRRLRKQTGNQEEVLAAGHTLTRVTGVAVVTVPASLPIETHMALLEASARRRKFELMRLDLAQPLGFVCGCIPVGVGLPKRRGKK